jgi:hypothetical protein
MAPGQWHPASDQHPVLGAADLSFVRSVLDLSDCSFFNRELALTGLSLFRQRIMTHGSSRSDDKFWALITERRVTGTPELGQVSNRSCHIGVIVE